MKLKKSRADDILLEGNRESTPPSALHHQATLRHVCAQEEREMANS
jgi:hypothetical protein